MKQHARARQKLGLDGARPRAKLLGVDAAGHSDHSPFADAEMRAIARSISAEIAAKPVLARIARRRATAPRVRSALSPLRNSPRSPAAQRRLATQERPCEPGCHGFPQGLMSVDHIDLGLAACKAPGIPVKKLSANSGPP